MPGSITLVAVSALIGNSCSGKASGTSEVPEVTNSRFQSSRTLRDTNRSAEGAVVRGRPARLSVKSESPKSAKSEGNGWSVTFSMLATPVRVFSRAAFVKERSRYAEADVSDRMRAALRTIRIGNDGVEDLSIVRSRIARCRHPTASPSAAVGRSRLVNSV